MRLAATITSLVILATPALAQLDPPDGPVTPTFKTLDQVQPSTPIGPDTTPGDAESLFQITQPGAYHLTGNIIGVAGKHGIKISADNVTLDLGGFTVAGVEGALCGVRADPYDADYGAVVRNGAVTAWGESGVWLAGCEGAVVEDIRATHNGADGVYAGYYAQVSSVFVIDNVHDGVYTSGSSTLRDCTAARNGRHGIVAGSGSTIRASSSYDNAEYGIYLGANGTAQDCSARNNDEAGIYAYLGCTVTNCSAGYNHTGFIMYRMNTMRDCNASFNGSVGVAVTGGYNRIENNNIIASSTCLDVDGWDNFISGNTAGGSPLEYDVVSNNLLAPVTGSISGSTPPFSNFSR